MIDEEIEWVDLRFTDPKGKWQHLTMVADVLTEDELEDGLMFDGSSIAGWKVINESDMILRPDLERVYLDPFSATPMMIIFCDIVEPNTGDWYARDPRSTAKRAEAYLKSTGVGDTVYVGPEAEFFMFDDVRFEDGYAGSGFSIDDIELPTNSGREYDAGNMAHRPRAKGGYFPVPPHDSLQDLRSEWAPAEGRTTPTAAPTPSSATACLWQPWASSSSGWAGSASTPARHSARM